MLLITNARLINRGTTQSCDILLHKGRIHRIAPQITEPNAKVLDARGNWVIPGIILSRTWSDPQGLYRLRKPRSGCGWSDILYGNA